MSRLCLLLQYKLLNCPQRNRNSTNTEGEVAPKNANEASKQSKDNQNRPKRLELTEAEKALVKQGKASVAMVRVLQADGSAATTTGITRFK